MGQAAAAGRDEPRGPQRRCIASGEVRDKRELLRFVVDPEGVVVPDPGEDLPGRGIWCLPRRDMIERARRRRQFARAARRNVTVPEDLADGAEARLRRRCLERLGLARRAGAVVAGFAKVRGVLERGAADLLLQACDAAPDGRDRLRRLGCAVRPELAVIALFRAEELGAALGRGPTVHVAVQGAGHAARLRQECGRLAGLVAGAEACQAGGRDGQDAETRRLEPNVERTNRAPERNDDE